MLRLSSIRLPRVVSAISVDRWLEELREGCHHAEWQGGGLLGPPITHWLLSGIGISTRDVQ